MSSNNNVRYSDALDDQYENECISISLGMEINVHHQEKGNFRYIFQKFMTDDWNYLHWNHIFKIKKTFILEENSIYNFPPENGSPTLVNENCNVTSNEQNIRIDWMDKSIELTFSLDQ